MTYLFFYGIVFFMPAMKKGVKVFVATYTNEDLKIGLMLGPLKFERSKRGGDYTSKKIPVATI